MFATGIDSLDDVARREMILYSKPRVLAVEGERRKEKEKDTNLLGAESLVNDCPTHAPLSLPLAFWRCLSAPMPCNARRVTVLQAFLDIPAEAAAATAAARNQHPRRDPLTLLKTHSALAQDREPGENV